MRRVIRYVSMLCLSCAPACVLLLFAVYAYAAQDREQRLQAAVTEIQKGTESFEQQIEKAERNRFRIMATDSSRVVSTEEELYLSLSSQADCDGLTEFLRKHKEIDSLHLLIEGALDTDELARCLLAMENCRLQVEWQPEEDKEQADLQESAKAFFSFPDGIRVPKETASVMEGNRLWRFCRQKTEGLTCTSFLFEGWGREDCAPILLLLEGVWEGEEDICQLMAIPAPEGNVFCSEYGIEAEDMNFDGRKDLLLDVGSSGGSGGSWRHYRSAVWKPEVKKFTFFASMPEQVHCFDREGKRIIYRGRCGAGDETVTAYEVIDGAYKETTSLNLVTWEEPAVLYHYENGELVEKFEVRGMEEVIERFPDLDYWSEG